MLRLAVLLLAIWTAPAIAADTPRVISWEDLIPAGADYPPDPLRPLSDQQKDDLGYLFRLKQAARGAAFGGNSEFRREIEETEADLRREGVDIDGLIGKLQAWEAERQRVDQMIATDLDGKLIKMPGYILPLEYNGKMITQFLLVPFVGACVHVPPPPANQIVHVTTKEGFLDAGIFAPVYVTGRLKAAGVKSRSLYLKDGNVDVAFGYTLEGTDIEPYKEKN
jgi:hypothetical protein